MHLHVRSLPAASHIAKAWIPAAILACSPLLLMGCQNSAETNNAASTDTAKARTNTLWQDAKSGMNQAEVKSVFRNAVLPREIDTLNDGARCELAIENYELNGYYYEVCFFFRNAELTQVTLSNQTATEQQFETVVDLLKVKYGPEMSSGRAQCTGNTIMDHCTADWLLESGTNISVLYDAIGANDPSALLNINYQSRTATALKKL